MSTSPRLHLASWAHVRAHGPGKRYGIMARPRPWERGDGRVDVLVPAVEDLDMVLARTMRWEEFERRCRLRFSAFDLRPGELTATGSFGQRLVEDGDTLCCACAVGSPCHRVVAAPLLLQCGWNVHLDGRRWTGPDPTLFGQIE